MLPGERFEVLVDTSDGKAFDLQTLPVQQMGMMLKPFDQPLPVLSVMPLQIMASGSLPEKLVDLPAVSVPEIATTRTLQLMMDPELDSQGMQALMTKYGHAAMAGMSMEGHGSVPTTTGKMVMSHEGMEGMSMSSHDSMSAQTEHSVMSHQAMSAGEHHSNMSASYDFHQGNKINGVAFDMAKPMFAAKQGQWEKWVISGEGDMMSHPFHIHGAQFRILSENGKPPAQHRSGWKDIVHVEGSRSEVLVRFNHLADSAHAYMAHCHLLEHEDTGMMLGFTVTHHDAVYSPPS